MPSSDFEQLVRKYAHAIIALLTLSIAVQGVILYHIVFNSTVVNINETSEMDRQTRLADRKRRIAQVIVAKYRAKPDIATEVVELAHKYAGDQFPQPHDLITVVAIESSFNPNARSKLRRDPAVGLTQIRPGVWKHLIANRAELKDVENQIKYGSIILADYYKRIGTREGALIAYNAGLTAYRKGRHNMRYIEKYQRVVGNFTMI